MKYLEASRLVTGFVLLFVTITAFQNCAMNSDSKDAASSIAPSARQLASSIGGQTKAVTGGVAVTCAQTATTGQASYCGGIQTENDLWKMTQLYVQNSVSDNSLLSESECANLCASQGVGYCVYFRGTSGSAGQYGHSSCSFCQEAPIATSTSAYGYGFKTYSSSSGTCFPTTTRPQIAVPAHAISSISSLRMSDSRQLLCALGNSTKLNLYSHAFGTQGWYTSNFCVTEYSAAGTSVVSDVTFVKGAKTNQTASCPSGYLDAGAYANTWYTSGAIPPPKLMCVKYRDVSSAGPTLTKFYLSSIPCANGDTTFTQYSTASPDRFGHNIPGYACGIIVP